MKVSEALDLAAGTAAGKHPKFHWKTAGFSGGILHVSVECSVTDAYGDIPNRPSVTLTVAKVAAVAGLTINEFRDLQVMNTYMSALDSSTQLDLTMVIPKK